MDDMFDDAAKKLVQDAAAAATKAKDPTLSIEEQDIMHLLTLDCVRAAVPRVCETKGPSTITDAGSSCCLHVLT
jgi:hypothetical protein